MALCLPVSASTTEVDLSAVPQDKLRQETDVEFPYMTETYWHGEMIKLLFRLLDKRCKVCQQTIYNIIVNKNIWTNVLELWGSSKPSNYHKIQSVQPIILRKIADASYYVSNSTIHSMHQERVRWVNSRGTTRRSITTSGSDLIIKSKLGHQSAYTSVTVYELCVCCVVVDEMKTTA